MKKTDYSFGIKVAYMQTNLFMSLFQCFTFFDIDSSRKQQHLATLFLLLFC